MSAAPERVGADLWRVAGILVLGTFMATLDATIVAVGVDTLADAFGARVADIHWVSTAYLLAVVAAVPASGWLAERYGGKRVWIGAVVGFVAASALCAAAWSLASLVAFRVLQGLAGGLLPPTGQALLARAAGPKIGRLISVVGVVPLLSPVLGPLLGGAILGVADWPWLFLVNLPIGITAVLLASRHVPAVAPAPSRPPFDMVGALLLAPGLATFVYGLSGPRPALALGTAMLAAYVGHALRSGRAGQRRSRPVPPLVDLRLFARPPFGAAALALLMLGASVFGTMFLLPLYLQDGAGLSPWEAGLLLAPQGAGAVAGSLLVQRLVDRTPPRTLVLAGITLVAAGTAPFTQLAAALPDSVVAAALVARGFGAALISAPIMALVYRRVSRPDIPHAAGALNLLNTLGGSLGTAALAVALQHRLTARGPGAIAAAFADAFWCVLALAVVAAVAAAWLPRRLTAPDERTTTDV
ncbi:MFS transporter [Pilimelia terevasa]|uniref:MFS transporter n=1 Tax=Pilimelia terevasa TaxID=53372 RepID=A0A8J3BP80_9ACTN|nr:DHA2 family efflux MFS transporter permease subunit [Pilimelia terevasa]GGK35989.1 MFS transporter [Pilimelia terevasa]